MSENNTKHKQLSIFDVIEIPMTKGYTTTVDMIDQDLRSFKWYPVFKEDGRVYASTIISKKPFKAPRLHRIIMSRILGRELLSSEQVDHWNRNTLDNRRENLRLATPAQNQQNQRRHIDSTTGYKGVRFSRGKWMARISVNGNRLYLGMFESPELAYEAYCEAAVKYHGEFRRIE